MPLFKVKIKREFLICADTARKALDEVHHALKKDAICLHISAIQIRDSNHEKE